MNPPLQKTRYVEYSQYFHLNSLQTTKRTTLWKMGIFHCYVVYQRVSVRKPRLFITWKNHPKAFTFEVVDCAVVGVRPTDMALYGEEIYISASWAATRDVGATNGRHGRGWSAWQMPGFVLGLAPLGSLYLVANEGFWLGSWNLNM